MRRAKWIRFTGRSSTTQRHRQRHKFCVFNEQKQKLCTPFTCFFFFVISVHFFPVLGKSASWNDHFSSFTEHVNLNFVYQLWDRTTKFSSWEVPLKLKKLNKLTLTHLSNVFATVASYILNSPSFNHGWRRRRLRIWHILHPLSRSREYLLRVEGQDSKVLIILAGYLVFLWHCTGCHLSSLSIQRLQSSPRVNWIKHHSNLHVDQTLPATTNTKSAMYLIRKTLWYSNKNSS